MGSSSAPNCFFTVTVKEWKPNTNNDGATDLFMHHYECIIQPSMLRMLNAFEGYHFLFIESTTNADNPTNLLAPIRVDTYLETSMKHDLKEENRVVYFTGKTMRQQNWSEGEKVNVSVVQPQHAQIWKRVTLWPLDTIPSQSLIEMKSLMLGRKAQVTIKNGATIEIPLRLTSLSGSVAPFLCKCEPSKVHNNNNNNNLRAWGVMNAKTVIEIGDETELEQQSKKGKVLEDQKQSIVAFMKLAFGLSDASRGSNRDATRMPIKIPRSFLIFGPRGVGKTHLIKEISQQLNTKILQVTPGDVYSKVYVEGERNLKIFLQKAQQFAQPCLIVFDEVEVLCPSRIDEKDAKLLHQFLYILSNVHKYANVILVGITSNIGELDPLVRKRFDEELFIDVPTSHERLHMFQQCVQSVPIAPDVDIAHISQRCHGYVLADVFALCRDASFHALQRVLNDEGNDTGDVVYEVNSHDFEVAYKSYKPVAIKEVSLIVPKVKWSDIGGLQNVKEKLEEMIVWPLRNSDAYKRMGIKPPVGILLYGPPGTGKTMIAKAVATASDANFIAVNISDLIKGEIGESEKTLSEMFRKAKVSSPCVIFFDEMQAMFGDRSSVDHSAQKLISQLLLELDALEYVQGVVVIAATNVPQNLDPSLLTPGRFERVLYVGPPDQDARRNILRMLFASMRLHPEVEQRFEEYISRTENYTGADMKNLCYQAGLNALCASLDAENISANDFEQAFASIRPTVTPAMIRKLEEWSTKSRS